MFLLTALMVAPVRVSESDPPLSRTVIEFSTVPEKLIVFPVFVKFLPATIPPLLKDTKSKFSVPTIEVALVFVQVKAMLLFTY